MATPISTIITNARTEFLREPTARFWTDAELLVHALAGISDLWRMVIDLHEEHFLTVDASNVSLSANTSTLTGIPTTCFRIVSIEARDLSSTSPVAGCEFLPRDWNHRDMVNARRTDPIQPKEREIFYTVTGKGPPVEALTVRVAPQSRVAIPLTVAFIPTHGAAVAGDNNPIPGESDRALSAWIAAYARAKEREDGSPDPNLLAVYATEKGNLRVALTPRQEQEIPVVEGLFEGW